MIRKELMQSGHAKFRGISDVKIRKRPNYPRLYQLHTNAD